MIFQWIARPLLTPLLRLRNSWIKTVVKKKKKSSLALYKWCFIYKNALETDIIMFVHMGSSKVRHALCMPIYIIFYDKTLVTLFVVCILILNVFKNHYGFNLSRSCSFF